MKSRGRSDNLGPLWVFIVSVAATCQVFGQETQIRVLGLITPDANVSVATSSLTNLVNTWANSGFPNGTTIVKVNNGVPVPVSFASSGDVLDRNLAAHQSPDLINLRHQHTADIVILFTGVGTSPCGIASQLHWIAETIAAPAPEFVTDATGLDLRARDSSFIAVVGTKNTCSSTQIAAHEFGHLLGGGHVDIPPTTNFQPWLLENSRAFVKIDSFYNPAFNQMFFVGRKTALSEGNPLACGATTSHTCATWDARFSEHDPGNPNALGSDDRDNHLTMFTTARSVANYYHSNNGGGGVFGGPPPSAPQCSDFEDNDMDGFTDFPSDPDCESLTDDNESDYDDGGSGTGGGGGGSCSSLTPPTNLDATLLSFCVDYSTQWTVTWDHSCPQSVTHYDISGRQPDIFGETWDFAGTVFGGANRSQGMWVSGQPVRIAARSCGPAGCSVYSYSVFAGALTSTVLLYPICFGGGTPGW